MQEVIGSFLHMLAVTGLCGLLLFVYLWYRFR